MNTFHFGYVFGPLHAIGMLAFAIGLFLLLVWAVKSLTHKQLQTWGLWLSVCGFVLCVLSMLAGAFARHGMDDGMMMHKRLEWHMGDDRMMNCGAGKSTSGTTLNGMDHSAMGMMMNGGDDDRMGMSMDDMTDTLAGKTGDAFDKAFLEAMIPHHQGAIDMAKLAERDAKHAEIRAMATAIISAQQREIDEMQQWQKAWGFAQ